MSVVELNPVDGLPEFKGRKVVTERQKLRAAKRAQRFVMVGWGDLASALCALRTDHATRLYLVLHLHSKLRRSAARDGWVELVQHDLKATGLAGSNFCKAVAKLEAAGLVEAQRRPGKRPLLRLTDTLAKRENNQ